jgi:hypothetical protein
MLVVTLVALGLCGAMAALTARLLRDDRRRAAARVAMLETAAASVSAPTGPLPAPFIAPPGAPVPVQEAPADAVLMRPAAARIDRPASETPVASADLFSTTAAAPGGGFGFAGAAVIGIAIVALAIGAFAWSGGSSLNDAPAAAVDGESSGPLELVALSHARTGDGLTVSGMVRNPPTGIARAHLTAVVFIFDRQGTFLTSTRAPIEPVNLNPGTQSLFTVNVPQAAGVSRYRVSFRTDLGVVPHVDRRVAATVEKARS